MRVKGVSPLQQKLAWLFLGKRLLRDDKYNLHCSRCGTTMKKIVKDNVVIDLCPRCGGLFLDDGEIDKLSKIGGKQHGKKKSK